MHMKSILARFFSITASVALVSASGADVATQSPSAVTNLLGQLNSAAASGGDPTLKSLGGELGSKIQASHESLADNPKTQGQLSGALKSILGNKGGEALAAFQKLSQTKLTPEQTKLAKDVGHLGSAYLVHKNLGNLEGSQSDVAQIVYSLRKGNITESLPAIKKVSQNAKLTPAQKELLTSLADKYAPGASKESGALKGVKGIPDLGK
jgi:hypothetical protein